MAELNLQWTTVHAPIAGRVSDKRVDIGTLVTGGQAGATLLTTVVTLDPTHFVFDVSETDYLRYARLFLSGDRPSSREIANPVKLKLADEKDFVHNGRMNFVDNSLNPRSGTLRARAVFDNKDNLFQPGEFARLQLFGGDSDALRFPMPQSYPTKRARLSSRSAPMTSWWPSPSNSASCTPVCGRAEGNHDERPRDRQWDRQSGRSPGGQGHGQGPTEISAAAN